MTDPYAAEAADALDIEDAPDAPSRGLDRQADALLREPRMIQGAPSIRESMRHDAEAGRVWAYRRSELAREAIRESPRKATLYALGVGVLLGLLIAR